MSVYHELTVDISTAYNGSPVTLKQGDTGRSLIIYPTQNGAPWAIPDGAVVNLRILNPLRQSTEIPAGVSTHKGKECIEAKLTAEAVAVVGICVADATIDDGETVSTLNFRLDVQPAPASKLRIPTPGGTSDYNHLSNRPRINGVVLEGDTSLAELGGVSFSDLTAAMAQNSAADQTFASSAALAAASEVEGKIPDVPAWALTPEKPSYTADEVGAASKSYVDEQDDSFFQSLDAANRRISALESRPAGVTETKVNEIVGAAESRFSESITDIERRLSALEDVDAIADDVLATQTDLLGVI